jgi:hypothetical protein
LFVFILNEELIFIKKKWSKKMKLAVTNVIPPSVPSVRNGYAGLGFSGEVTPESKPATEIPQSVQTEPSAVQPTQPEVKVETGAKLDTVA